MRDPAQLRERHMRMRAREGLRVPVLPADQAAAKGLAARARLPEREDQPQKWHVGRARCGLHGETGRHLLRRPHVPHHEGELPDVQAHNAPACQLRPARQGCTVAEAPKAQPQEIRGGWTDNLCARRSACDAQQKEREAHGGRRGRGQRSPAPDPAGGRRCTDRSPQKARL